MRFETARNRNLSSKIQNTKEEIVGPYLGEKELGE